MGGKSKKKAAKKASAEVKASFTGAAAAAEAGAPTVRSVHADLHKDEPGALDDLVQLIAEHAGDEDKKVLVTASHELVTRSLGPVPSGQSLPDCYGEMLFYGLTMFQAMQRGIVGDERHVFLEEQVKECRMEHAVRTERELREYLDDVPGDHFDRLSLVLSGRVDAYAIQDILIGGEQVHVAPAGHKGDGVFASRNMRAGAIFTAYPCHGLWISSRDNHQKGRTFVSQMLFPCWEGELNMRYAVKSSRADDPMQVRVIGHKAHHRWFACGHMVNDSHTVEEAGSAECYRAVADGNCEPVLTDEGAVVMMTTRDVVKGEELLYNYGVKRWTEELQCSHVEARGAAVSAECAECAE